MYDGQLNGEDITYGIQTASILRLAKNYQLRANSIINGFQQSIKSAVSSPKISVDKELPEWTNDYVEVTLGSSNRIILDIVNEDESGQNIVVNKQWKTANPDNHRATIQLFKLENGEKVPVIDKETGEELTVQIIGNNRATFENVPIYENGETIEYTVEEIQIEQLIPESNQWEIIDINKFKATYLK